MYLYNVLKKAMAILNLSKPEIRRYNENYSLFNDKTSVLIAVKTTTRSELEGPDFDALERVNGYHKSCGRTSQRPHTHFLTCLLYTSPSPRDKRQSRMPSSA